MVSILQVTGLTKKFGQLTAVDHLSFNIKKGHVYGLLGPNGSGKSTTLGMILNVVNKTGGNFKWFEGKISNSEALKRIGAIIERPNFYPYMTARQNLNLVCKIKEISTDSIEEKLELVELSDRQHDKFKTYSLGMKQRLAIASASKYFNTATKPKLANVATAAPAIPQTGIKNQFNTILSTAAKPVALNMRQSLCCA